MTGGGNKPRYVWASYLSTLSPYQFTKGKAENIERSSRGDYLGICKPLKDIDLHHHDPIKASFWDRELYLGAPTVQPVKCKSPPP
jgi:hypothetical protein